MSKDKRTKVQIYTRVEPRIKEELEEHFKDKGSSLYLVLQTYLKSLHRKLKAR